MAIPVGTVAGSDGRARCPWGAAPPDYASYHDDEWGRPVLGESHILEKLCLEAFQSGLSWLTILRKRNAFRRAFADFDPLVVAAYDEDDVVRLLADPSIVRHRGKINATIANARATVALHDSGGTLADLLWGHAPGDGTGAPTTMDQIPARTTESGLLASELKALGFRFLGPTTAYAAMQALGVVDDHVLGCYVRADCEADRRAVLDQRGGLRATPPG